MSEVQVAVLYGFGINCDRETAAVFELVGAKSTRVHLNEFISKSLDIHQFDILAIPGGFSFGDHLGSGRLLGNRLRFALREELQKFVQDGKPIIGICNGFQVLVKTGLLPGPLEGEIKPDFVQRASLTLNNSGRYEDRWVTLEFDPQSPCIWTKDVSRISCPVRHGEGKFVMPDKKQFDQLSDSNMIAVRYVDPSTKIGEGITDEILPFPLSPNGSSRNIAGICDKSGLVFGLMPHPEAIYARWLHPLFVQGQAPIIDKVDGSEMGEWEGEGLQIFRNAVNYSLGK